MAAVAKKPAPHSIEDLLLAARRDRKAVKQLLGQAVLNGRPDAEVKALQEELDLHTAAIERFTAAIEAQAQAKAEQSLEERKDAVADARSAIANRDAEIDRLVGDLLAGISGIAPLAVRLRDAIGERNGALRAGLKAGLDRDSWTRVNTEGVITPLPFVSAALGTALLDSGLPGLGVHVEVGSRSDAEELSKNLQRVAERTERLLRKADACLSAPTDDDLDEEL